MMILKRLDGQRSYTLNDPSLNHTSNQRNHIEIAPSACEFGIIKAAMDLIFCYTKRQNYGSEFWFFQVADDQSLAHRHYLGNLSEHMYFCTNLVFCFSCIPCAVCWILYRGGSHFFEPGFQDYSALHPLKLIPWSIPCRNSSTPLCHQFPCNLPSPLNCNSGTVSPTQTMLNLQLLPIWFLNLRQPSFHCTRLYSFD